MQIRLANESDTRLIFEWRNDPLTISTSRTQAGIEWDGHSKWFPAQLSKPETTCLIGEEAEPCGVVWFRKGRSGVYETSVNLAPQFRGKKLSAPMLGAAADWMRNNKSAQFFSTEIQDTNVASIKMFERCGFVYVHPSPGFGTYVALAAI